MLEKQALIIRIDRAKLQQTLTVLPGLIIIMGFLWYATSTTILANISENKSQKVSDIVTPEAQPENSTGTNYPQTGREINIALFNKTLPPPPLDALPYDVRKSLSNGTSVPVKKRWIWVPDGKQITVNKGINGQLNVDIPVGTLWWKEFYIETDRGTFLIERRIIARVPQTSYNVSGWAFYSSHYATNEQDANTPLILASDSPQAGQFMFQPTDWLPTQSAASPSEIRFEDTRGLQYPYLFPGQTQCTACHNGASGAYPNTTENPIAAFGLHPNNLTHESYAALVTKGWISGGDALLTAGYMESKESILQDASFDELTTRVVALVRNNCASCHNASPSAAANFTSFILDPNRNYSSAELLQLLSATGRMMPNAFPLVTPGKLEQSELWLRINGLEGRRRMPPKEGGLPEIDPNIVDLWRSWIIRAGTQQD